jgi:hypothetical protein
VARKGRMSRARLEVDAHLVFAIFAAVGMATWSLGQSMRLTLAWLTLLAWVVVYGTGHQ